jgi:hypothetical protein
MIYGPQKEENVMRQTLVFALGILLVAGSSHAEALSASLKPCAELSISDSQRAKGQYQCLTAHGAVVRYDSSWGNYPYQITDVYGRSSLRLSHVLPSGEEYNAETKYSFELSDHDPNRTDNGRPVVSAKSPAEAKCIALGGHLPTLTQLSLIVKMFDYETDYDGDLTLTKAGHAELGNVIPDMFRGIWSSTLYERNYEWAYTFTSGGILSAWSRGSLYGASGLGEGPFVMCVQGR